MFLSTSVDLACSDETFSILCSAVEAAGLDSVLGSAGPFTLFAPTNEAFERLGQSTITALLGDVPALTDLLLYHVVADNAEISSDDLVCRSLVPMANGDVTKTSCHRASDRVFQIGRGNVERHQRVSSYPELVGEQGDACNGIVHAVDNVILPKSVTPPSRGVAGKRPKKKTKRVVSKMSKADKSTKSSKSRRRLQVDATTYKY